MNKLLATFLCSLVVLEMVLMSPLVAVGCVTHSLENHRKEESCSGQPTRTASQTCGCCNAHTTPSPADNHDDHHDDDGSQAPCPGCQPGCAACGAANAMLPADTPNPDMAAGLPYRTWPPQPCLLDLPEDIFRPPRA
ncbi:MAG: hypothetical protein BWX88_03481 [Planctomycetes bacterium ADurb.Bin126]|nr:MAG: hypothetical protein BWX88_03481 [Planctomycetes bacterium ADurb.Bin126]